MFQILLNNPLAEPGLLGVSGVISLFVIAGASISAILSIKYDVFFMLCFALFGALFAIGFIFKFAKHMGSFSNATLILAGITLTTITSAIASWFIFYSTNDHLRSYSLWLLGSFEHVSLLHAISLLTIAVAVSYYVHRRANDINLMMLGDDNALLYGVNIKKLRQTLLLSGALLCAIAVSLGGIIAFLGLLIPHAVRRRHGNNNKHIFKFIVTYGATTMILIEWLSRTISIHQLPLSLISAAIGGPVFMYVLINNYKNKI